MIYKIIRIMYQMRDRLEEVRAAQAKMHFCIRRNKSETYLSRHFHVFLFIMQVLTSRSTIESGKKSVFLKIRFYRKVCNVSFGNKHLFSREQQRSEGEHPNLAWFSLSRGSFHLYLFKLLQRNRNICYY